MTRGGRRAAARRGPRRRPKLRGDIVLLLGGVLLAMVTWAFLVFAAIDFGKSARAGNTDDWVWLGVISLSAVAVLFCGLLLASRTAQALGITSAPEPATKPAKPGNQPPTGPPGPAAYDDTVERPVIPRQREDDPSVPSQVDPARIAMLEGPIRPGLRRPVAT